MHLATLPSAEVLHQSGWPQIGQGADLEARSTLLVGILWVEFIVGPQACSGMRPAPRRRALLFRRGGRRPAVAGVNSVLAPLSLQRGPLGTVGHPRLRPFADNVD